MQDKRFDARPKLNYNFSSGCCAGEERVTASYKNKRPTRSSMPPISGKRSNPSFVASGKAGKEFPQLKRDKADAQRLLTAALQALGD